MWTWKSYTYIHKHNDTLVGYITWCLLRQYYDLSHLHSLGEKKGRQRCLLSLALEVFDDSDCGPLLSQSSYHRSKHTVIQCLIYSQASCWTQFLLRADDVSLLLYSQCLMQNKFPGKTCLMHE